MSSSILADTKKLLGIADDDPSFDTDIVLLINSAISDLSQLGIGPAAGFAIEDAAATWEDLLGTDLNLSSAKALVYQKVRLVFDPPTTAHLLNALKEEILKNEWRLNVHREASAWVDPDPRLPSESVWGDPIVIDGGVG
jgi:hypothetical protein